MSQPPSPHLKPNDVSVLAWRATMDLHRRFMTIFEEELIEECGMDLSTYDALLHVFEAGADGIRMTDLSQRLMLSKSGLTTAVDRLERAGLLRRIPDPADRRSIRIALTDDGEAAFRAAGKSHLASISRHFSSRVTDAEAQMMIDVIERVLAEE